MCDRTRNNDVVVTSKPTLTFARRRLEPFLKRPRASIIVIASVKKSGKLININGKEKF